MYCAIEGETFLSSMNSIFYLWCSPCWNPAFAPVIGNSQEWLSVCVLFFSHICGESYDKKITLKFAVMVISLNGEYEWKEIQNSLGKANGKVGKVSWGKRKLNFDFLGFGSLTSFLFLWCDKDYYFSVFCEMFYMILLTVTLKRSFHIHVAKI